MLLLFAVFEVRVLLEELVSRKPNKNPVTLQFLTVTPDIPVRVIPVEPPVPLLIVYPAQSSVMPLAPMTSPFPEQGPMPPLRVVLVVIVEPHDGLWEKTGIDKKTSIEPRTVKRSRTASRIFGDTLCLKTDRLQLDGLYTA